MMTPAVVDFSKSSLSDLWGSNGIMVDDNLGFNYWGSTISGPLLPARGDTNDMPKEHERLKQYASRNVQKGKN